MTTLSQIVEDFARGMMAVDAQRPTWTSRTGRQYQPGIGPHPEDAVVSLVLDFLRSNRPEYAKCGRGLQYPSSTQRGDVWIGDPLEWVIEVKMARLFGDNGKPDDTAIKDILSPYPVHRSSVTDCSKLATASFSCRKAVLIYGFDYFPDYPLEPLIVSFESLANKSVRLGPRESAHLSGLVHPVLSQGAVYAWEIESEAV